MSAVVPQGVRRAFGAVVAVDDLSLEVRPGEIYETTYFARNRSDRDMVGSATPSVAPARASKYFNKTECFCFTEQLLSSQESREMPVYFFVQPDLPESIKEITLSYTFYRNEEAERNSIAFTTAQTANEN